MDPRSAPGALRSGPRGAKTAPRGAKSTPRAPQEPPERRKKRSKKGHHLRLGSRGGLREASGSPPGASGERFWSYLGSILASTSEGFCSTFRCSRCCSSWLPSVSWVSSWRCGSHFSQGFSGMEPESREKKSKTQDTLPAPSAEAAARSADARHEASVRARCLDALAVPLVVVIVLLGASSPSPLAVFAAIFALLLRLPGLRLSR